MNRLTLFGILWSLAISVGSAQDSTASKDENSPIPPVTEPSGDAVPVNPQTIVLILDAAARQSDVVKQVVETLEKAGIATGKAAETTPLSSSSIGVTLGIRKDESHEKIKQLIEALRNVGVQQISFRAAGSVKATWEKEQNVLILHVHPGYTTDELHRIKSAARTAAKQCGLPLVVAMRGLEGTEAGEFFGPPEPASLEKRSNPEAASFGVRNLSGLAGPAKEVPASVIQVFALKNSQATSTTDLLMQLITVAPFRAVADELHNSVVVIGSTEQLQAVEKLLLTLDEALREPSAEPKHDGKSAVDGDASKQIQQQVAELRTDYETANKNAHDLAKSLREITGGRVDNPNRTEMELQIEKSLEQKVALHFHEVELAEVIRHIATVHGINIAMKTRAIESGGLLTRKLVSIDVDGITLRSVLRLLPDQVGGLVYSIENETLMISNKQGQETKSDNVVDKMADLAAEKAELRTAVQRAFTLRQSLLQAELLEMQTRLLQTQQSLDMRERIADQIVDRRVEDLLNPQLDWEQALSGELKTQAEFKPTEKPESSVVEDSGVVTELEGDWHLVAYIDKWQTERRPRNMKIRANQWTTTDWTGESVSRTVIVDENARTIDFGSMKVKNGLPNEIASERGTYELTGDVLTIHSEYACTDSVSGALIQKGQDTNIWNRGLCEIGDYDGRNPGNGMGLFYLNGNDKNTGYGTLLPGTKVDVFATLTLPNGTPLQRILVESLEVDGSSEPTANSERQMRLLGTREQCLLLQNTAKHEIMSLRIRKPNDKKNQFPDGINREAFKELDAASRNRDLEPTVE